MEVDPITQSIDALSDILMMATEQSTDLADKLIKMNAENTVETVKDETIGRAIDIIV